MTAIYTNVSILFISFISFTDNCQLSCVSTGRLCWALFLVRNTIYEHEEFK